MLRKLLLLLCLNAWCAVSVYGAEPTTAASNLAAGTITCKTVQLTWTSGNGSWRIVLMKEGSSVNATPSDNSSYLSNSVFGTGQEIGTGNFVVFNNITNNCTVTGLKPNTQYYVTVFEHDGAGPDYLTSKSATVSFKTNNLVMGFSFKGTQDSCEKSNKITFTNTSTATFGWIKYTWIFGDGTQDTGVNITHTYNKGGNFTVNLVASPALGCTDVATSTKSIFIVPRPVSKPFEKNADTVQCFEGHIFKLDDNTQLAKIPKCAYIRTWYFADDDSATIPNPSKSYAKPGKYRIHYKSETLYDNLPTGCTDTANMWVRVVPSPSSGISINDSIQCLAGNKFDFDNRFPGLISFRWDLGGGITGTTKTISRSFAAVGDYPIIHEATSVDGCSGIDTIIVKVRPNVNPSFTGLPATACQGGPAITLTPTTAGGVFYGQSFTGNTFQPSSTGMIKIKYVVTDQYCPDSSTQTITIQPKPTLYLGKDTTLCDGATLDLTITIPGTVLWNDGSSANVKTVAAAGTFGAVVNNSGCIASDSINIRVNTAPMVTLPMDTILCQGSIVKLVAPYMPNTNILWSTGSTDTVIYVNVAGTYTVTVSNACGSASDDVVVNLIPGDCDLFVPTAFTPNGDNRNESFKIFGRGAVPILFLVYNRWGDKVFDSHEKNVYEWDGYYMNDICQEGIYTFIYRYELKTGDRVRRKTISGTIMLMR